MAEINYEVLANEFGLAYQLVNAIPEVRDLFDKAVAGEWDARRFQAALQGTNWWRNNSEKQRQMLIKQLTDPATVVQDLDNAKYKVRGILAGMGYTNVDESYIESAARRMLYDGWDEGRVRYDVGEGTLSGGFQGMMDTGQAGQFAQQMRTLAYQNGIKIDEQWLTNYYGSILKGTSTVEQAARDIRNQAAAKFTGFAEQIQAGQNVMDIASPYIQGMANVLELNGSAIDLFDPTIVDALSYKDSTGVSGTKPLWQFEVDLKKDPRWLATNNAREGMFGVARQVGKDLGLMY